MCDWFVPSGDMRCPPPCGARLTEWQGKDDPCALFVWRQGEVAPIEQPIDEEVALTPDERARMRLPGRFVIYSYDCEEHHPTDAACACEDGVWVQTELLRVRGGPQPGGRRWSETKKPAGPCGTAGFR